MADTATATIERVKPLAGRPKYKGAPVNFSEWDSRKHLVVWSSEDSMTAFAIQARLQSNRRDQNLAQSGSTFGLRSVALLLLGVAIALMAAGIGISVTSGTVPLAILFPIGATILFIATILAGWSRGGNRTQGSH